MNAAATRITYREACRQAIRDALRADPRSFVLGEDVGKYGGCYAVTKGLLDEFGPERIVDAPLAENGFTGLAIGAALAGLRPLLEIMTCNFSLLALDQIMNNAATIPHMSGGQFAVPIVIRMATGGGRQLAAQHSHSLEGWFAHIPGLKVAVPATVEDARFMLGAALADPNPVLIFEHVMLYNAEAELDPAVSAVDLAQAKVRRPGRDVTLVTYGNGVPKCRGRAAGARRHRRRGHRPAPAAPARHGHRRRIGGAHTALRDRRRRLEERVDLGRDRRAPGRGFAVRTRRADQARVQPRAAGALCRAHGRGRAAARR